VALVDDLDTVYENLANCCQRHICRLGGYCSAVICPCRFGYPMELQVTSGLEFEERDNTVKAVYKLKRTKLQVPSVDVCHIFSSEERGNMHLI
jgi:hypothetical protein